MKSSCKQESRIVELLGFDWVDYGRQNKCVIVVTYSIDITKLSQSNIEAFGLISQALI